MKTYNAEHASNRVLLCENEIYKINRYINPEYPDEWKPPRQLEKLGWWKQMPENAQAQNEVNADRLKRENEASKKNKRTANELEVAIPILEKHRNIGQGPRRHELLLDEEIDFFDQGLTELNEGVQRSSGRVLNAYKEYLKKKKKN